MPTLRCKVLILGDAKVGKSALTQMFHSDGSHYPKNYIMTVGVEFCVKTVIIPDTNYVVELYLFDCAGQDMYAELVAKYIPGSSMLALVYDVTNKDSFNSLATWAEVVKKNALPRSSEKGGLQSSTNFDNFSTSANGKNDALSGLPGVLIANKTDLEERTVVKPHLGNEFAQSHGLEFFEASALRGKDVDAPFNFLASRYYETYLEKIKQFTKK